MLNQILKGLIDLPYLNTIFEDCGSFTRSSMENILNQYINVAMLCLEVKQPILKKRSLHELENLNNTGNGLSRVKLGVWELDMHNDKLFISPNYYKILGFKPYEFPSTLKLLTERLHPEDRNYAVNKLFEMLYRRTSGYNVQFRLRTKDGSYKSIICKGRLVEDANNASSLKVTGVVLDISRAESALILNKGPERNSYLSYAQ